MPRLLILSNRLPVTLRVGSDAGSPPPLPGGDLVSIAPSSGGLASALRRLHEQRDSLWIGWSGDVSPLSEGQRRAVEARLASQRLLPVHLSAAEVSRYYDGFSNSVLWPLLHYFLDKVNLDDRSSFEAYEAVNERFAAAAAQRYRPGDVFWVHDYQLMLVPEMLRRLRPDAKIGFFLHTPFPSSEVFRVLPWRERLLRGLLGADVIGFHTASYRAHFAHAAARLLGIAPAIGGFAGLSPPPTSIDTLCHEGRRVQLGVYPIGVDAAELGRLADRAGVRAEAQRIREQAPGGRMVLGVDRLDYSKGLLRRLAAIERFLERSPELRRTVRFVQLAVPTREGVDAYEQMRREVNERVGRINAGLGSLDVVPIHFLYRSTPLEALTALYVAADVMLVTPLRDGMNLVAKEYAATRLDDTGALILSEFTGAAAELAEALIVNPYDVEEVASAIDRALRMPLAEQRLRMGALRRRVVEHDVHRWAGSFLDDLASAPARAGARVRGAELLPAAPCAGSPPARRASGAA